MIDIFLWTYCKLLSHTFHAHMWVNAGWIWYVDCVWVHCVAHTCVRVSGGACVALCLVLTHPAINCVSTAAVCIGQIESSATGPFCFSPLGWASRPPHSHWSQPSFSFCFFFSFWMPLYVCLSLFFCLTHLSFSVFALYVSRSARLSGDRRTS